MYPVGFEYNSIVFALGCISQTVIAMCMFENDVNYKFYKIQFEVVLSNIMIAYTLD